MLKFLLPLIFAVFVAVVHKDVIHRAKLIYFTITKAEGGQMALPDMSQCETPDFDEFREKALRTPILIVESIEDCLKHGEAMNHPLICRLANADESNTQKIIDAILSDKNVYAMTCRDEGDYHYITANTKLNSTIADVFQKQSPCSAGFIYGNEHQALLKNVMPIMSDRFDPKTVQEDAKASEDKRVVFGTTFASNFKEDRISTGSHAAMIISIAFQLSGTKKWILHNIEESSSDYFFDVSWIMYPNCLASYLKGMKRPYTAVSLPGDMLFFPFAWQHLVYSEAGPNVMTNIRKFVKPDMPFLLRTFSVGSFLQLVSSIASTTLFGSKTGNPREGVNEGTMEFASRVRASSPAHEKQNVKNFVEFLKGVH